MSVCACWCLSLYLSVSPRRHTHIPEKDTLVSRHGEEKENTLWRPCQVATFWHKTFERPCQVAKKRHASPTQPSDDHFLNAVAGTHNDHVLIIFRHCTYPSERPFLPMRTVTTLTFGPDSLAKWWRLMCLEHSHHGPTSGLSRSFFFLQEGPSQCDCGVGAENLKKYFMKAVMNIVRQINIAC